MGVVGSAIGAIIPTVLPEPILISILTLCLFAIDIITACKLISICKEENLSKK
jgi:hypothetical protein